jgi:hypothetical protein
MPRKCLVCESQETRKIDEMLVNRVSISEISRTFEIPYHSVDRHKKNHLPKALVKATQAGEVAHADTLIDQVKELKGRAHRITEMAEKTGSLEIALRGIRELRGLLELLAEVTGELQRGTRVGIQFIDGQPSRVVAIGSEEWKASFRDVLDRIIEDAGDDDDYDIYDIQPKARARPGLLQ